MDLKQIDSALSGLRLSRKNYESKTQDLAIAIMQHAKDHGDCTRALKLVLVCGPRERSQMVNYFAAFSPIKVVVGKDASKNKVSYAERDSKAYNPFDIDAAQAIHWLAYGKPSKPPKSHNLNSFRSDFQALIKRYEEKIKKGEVADYELIEDDIKSLRDAVAARALVTKTPLEVPSSVTELAEEALAASSWGKAA